MRLAMVIGEQRLALEQRMLNRLAVGLIAEGVQVTRLVPEGWGAAMAAEGERRMGLAPRIEVALKTMPWLRKQHVMRAADALEEHPPDALVLLGRDAWAFGLQLAPLIDRPALLEVWSATQAMQLPRPQAHPHLAAAIAPCEGIARVVRDRLGHDLTALVPMGAAASSRGRQVLSDPEIPPAIAVLGGARDLAAYAAMFNGLSRIAQSQPAVQIFLELRGPHEHDIWRLADRAGLLNSLSAFSSAAQAHALLMRCDLVLWPERYGELRSILLEAMAMALPVVASADHALDMLVDGRTAHLVMRDAADAWAERLEAALASPAASQEMGARARECVLAQHQSSAQISRLMQTISAALGGENYAFPSQG